MTSYTGEQLTVDSDDEFQYEEVPVDEDFVAPGNFKESLKSIVFMMILIRAEMLIQSEMKLMKIFKGNSYYQWIILYEYDHLVLECIKLKNFP